MKFINLLTIVLAAISINNFAMNPTEQEGLQRELFHAASAGNVEQLAGLLQISQQQGKHEHKKNMVELLQAAARNNHIGCIYALLNAGASINSHETRSGLPRTPLFAAVESQLLFIVGQENLARVRPLQLPQQPYSFDYDQGGKTDTLATIRELLARGADPAFKWALSQGANGTSALDLALECQSCFRRPDPQYQQIGTVIDVLIDHNALPTNLKACKNLFVYLVINNDYNNVQRLLPRIKHLEGWQETLAAAVAIAIYRNKTHMLLTFFSDGIDVNNPLDDNLRTPLFTAVESQLMFIVGANPRKIPYFNFNNSFYGQGGAADNSEAIQLLLDLDANPAPATRTGKSALGLAVETKSYFPQDAPERARIDQIINLLQEHGAALSPQEAIIRGCENNPLINSFNESMDNYVDNYHQRSQRIHCACNNLTVGLIMSSFASYLYGIYRCYKKGSFNFFSLAGVSGTVFFLTSLFKNQVITWLSDKGNRIYNNILERSLLSKASQIRASNPDQQTQRALQFIANKPRTSGKTDKRNLSARCAAHLGIQLPDQHN